MKFINQAEGYIEPDGAGGYDYVYQYKDQVNNIRLSYSDLDGDSSIDPSTEILHERNYYPFGMFHFGYNNAIAGVKNNLKTYQDQEFTEDLELNVHEWRFRFSDPAIGRFWSIDPLAEDYSYQSPYNFSENRVIDAFELEGLEKVSIHTRSFAPFNHFGFVPPFGPFKGDGSNRGFTTSSSASSRISGRIDLNLSGGGITQTGKDREGSISTEVTTGRTKESKAEFSAILGERNTSDGTTAATTLGFHLSGNNSLVPGSPDIDVKGALGIGVTEHKDGSSTAVISGEIFGDNFPSNETFLTDVNGTSVFLGVSGAILGPNIGPALALPGNNNRDMSSFNISLNFDKKGGVYSVQAGGKTYTIDQWNKLFENQNPKKGNTSTNH